MLDPASIPELPELPEQATHTRRSTSTSSSDRTADVADEAEPMQIPPENQHQILKLARRFTQDSVHAWPHGSSINPFTDAEDTCLDPNSPKFSAKRWVQALIELTSQDPERYPKRRAGVSYRHLSVGGYGGGAAYQPTVANVVLQGLRDLMVRLVPGRRREVQILRDHDGIVRSGEMLLVLGKPGRFVLSDLTSNSLIGFD